MNMFDINKNNTELSLLLASACALSCSPPSTTATTAIADTGATGHYFMPTAPVADINHTAPSTTVRTATGQHTSSSATAHLTLPCLPTAARLGHVMPGFTNNLISIGKLCDADCSAYFNKTAVTIFNCDGLPILHGYRETTGARLWRFNITATTPQAVAATAAHHPASPPTAEAAKRAYDLPSTPALIEFLHAAAGYPVKSTWLAAIKAGNYTTWPGLTYELAAKYCPDPDCTHKGHMAQMRQHVRSTEPKPPTPPVSPPSPLPTMSLPTPPDTHEVHITEIAASTLFTDDTGRFPIRSRSGNQYIMVAYHQASNAILVQPFQSKHDHHRIPAYNTIMTRLKARGLQVTRHVLDNEASTAYRNAITSTWKCTYQLVPPDMHRRNLAERAIRTFKAHFLTILAGVDATFPANRWDLLIPQAELTVNLLRQATTTPTISAWECINGPFNFDATPMGPPGCRALLHAKPNTRRSWDFRSLDGFYVGPALNHYRCFTLLKRESQAVVISDTICFRHPTFAATNPSTEDRLIYGLRTLTKAIQNKSFATTAAQLEAIENLRNIIHAWRDAPALPPGASPPPPQRVDTHTTLRGPPQRVAPTTPPGGAPTTPPGTPPRAAPTTTPTATPTRQPAQWTIVRPSTRAAARAPPTDAPISSRTRAQLGHHASNAFAALADDNDEDEDDTPLATPVLDHDTGKTLEHRQLRRHPKYKDVWDKSYGNELGRLCQGIGRDPANPTKQRVAGTDTFRPIKYANIPHERRVDVTYPRVVCEVRPQKEDPNRTRITIGGNRICYPGDCGTKTGSLETVKLIINSALSRPNAKFACYDISNFYLGTPLDRPEYVRIKLSDIPQDFIDEYKLHEFERDGWIYFEITKGVYGLKQSGKLANDLLTERLNKHGYYQCATTPGLWRHKWRTIVFVLIVDDFGIEYCEKRHADHLLTALQETYQVTTDWTGSKFAGIDLTWNYTNRTCRLTMNGYISDILTKYGHPRPAKPQHAPHKHREIIYGAKSQLEPDDDTSPRLPDDGIKRVQGIIGSLLYYARAVDSKLLTTLSTIGAQQANATTSTLWAVEQLLDYVATYPNDGTTYRASDMILAAHSDASYLSEPKSRSRAGAHIFVSENDPIPRPNGPVLTISTTIKFVMASAAEAELSALYLTAREMVPLRNTLVEMGWPQPNSPIQTDNSTAVGFTNDTIITRRIKMLCMRLHWLRCRESQGQFKFYWDKGSNNLADYHTKHHPPTYHIAHRPTHAG